jgi:hypothetical protein
MFFLVKIDIPHANKSLCSFRFVKWNEICHQNMKLGNLQVPHCFEAVVNHMIVENDVPK